MNISQQYFVLYTYMIKHMINLDIQMTICIIRNLIRNFENNNYFSSLIIFG